MSGIKLWSKSDDSEAEDSINRSEVDDWISDIVSLNSEKDAPGDAFKVEDLGELLLTEFIIWKLTFVLSFGNIVSPHDKTEGKVETIDGCW